MKNITKYAIIKHIERKEEKMKKDIKKWTIDDIIQEMGIIMPIIEVINCISFSEDMVEDFINKYDTYEEFPKLMLKRYEKQLNLKRLLFLNYMYLSGKKIPSRDNKEELENWMQARKKIANGKKEIIEMLQKYFVQNPIINLDAIDGTFLINIDDSRDYTTQEQKEKHQKERSESLARIEEIKSKINIDKLLQHMLNDIEGIYVKVPGLGEYIRNNIISDTLGTRDLKTIYQVIQEEISDVVDEKFIPQFKKELIDKAEYIDWDKFLLMSAYKIKNLINSISQYDNAEKEIKSKTRDMQICNELIRDRKTKINCEIVRDTKDRRYIKYSASQLKQDIEKNIIDGIYYGETRLKQIKEELTSGKISVSDISNPHLFELLRMSREEKLKCMDANGDNAISLYKNGIISKNEFNKYLENHTINAEQIKVLIEDDKKKKLESKEIVELYLKGKIELEEIATLKEYIYEEVTEERLINFYREREKEDKKERSQKYFALYREIKIREATEEEKEQISNNIILELGDEMEESDFIELYRNNLITINSIREWNGDAFVTNMMVNGLLKPADTKQIVKNNHLMIEEIKKELKQKDLTDEEKISLIITTFPEEEYTDLRTELFQYLTIISDNKERKKHEGITPSRDKKKGSKHYELDPCYKMQLLLLIDKDYSYSLTNDGHMILTLPNENKVIIEKMFKKVKDKVEIANGAATYVFNIAKYNSADILDKDGKIKRTNLYQLCDKDKKERYYHSKNWGEMIKEAFDLEHSEKHTEKEKDDIDQIIEKIKRTRKLKEF